MIDRFHRWLYKRAYPTLNVGYHVSLSGRNRFGVQTALSTGVVFRDSELGDYSYVNYHSIVHRTTIGKFCSIGPNVVIGLGNHPVRRFVSTSPKTFLPGSFSDREQYDQFPPVIIGNDVWIGANTTVLNGVKIGDGAVVGANSVVTKDVPPYAIYGGGNFFVSVSKRNSAIFYWSCAGGTRTRSGCVPTTNFFRTLTN